MTKKALFLLPLLLLMFSLAASAQQKVHKIDSITETDTIYFSADQMPKYPGGVVELNRYFERNIRIPVQLREPCLEKVSIVVLPDGSVGYMRPVEDCGFGAYQEAVTWLKKMPAWKPGTINGRPVAVRILIHIKFDPS